MLRSLIAAALALAFMAAPAHARLVTVPTAAGINITVADDMADAMQGFIADIVAAGVRPSQIHCYNLAASHVPNSLHFSGHACDFDGSANRFAAMNRHRVSAIAHRHGLRDGCDFNDCGHIDAGLAYAHRGGRRHYARRHYSRRRHLARR